MQVSVLGPLRFQACGKSVTPSAPKPRKVLALLLLNANQVVPVESLFAELWDDGPPPSAHTTLQTYILQLRRLISGASGESSHKSARQILGTEAGGYVFRIEPRQLDLHVYNELAAEGRRALSGRCWQTADRSLSEALALWRGPALVDVPAGRVLRPQILGLDESHLTTMEQHIDAKLHLGRHLELLSHLTELVTEYRFHENLHARLMLALHLSGRRQDALAAFQRLRYALVNELGLEPSQPLHALQRAILADDPALRMSWSGSGQGNPSAVPPPGS
jgi:SARP family transcriptional regulator, regulator of embCAB operon